MHIFCLREQINYDRFSENVSGQTDDAGAHCAAGAVRLAHRHGHGDFSDAGHHGRNGGAYPQHRHHVSTVNGCPDFLTITVSIIPIIQIAITGIIFLKFFILYHLSHQRYL